MRDLRLLLLALVALVGTACTVEPGTSATQREPLALPDATSPVPRFGLLTDTGVTDEACPDAVNLDNGCIHLGALVDRSGPWGPFGDAALAGAQAFWAHVNEQGGVTAKRHDGLEPAFDVALGDHVVDTRSDIAAHLDGYEQIEPHVLAVAASSGSAPTVEALPRHVADHLPVVPLGSWSGWQFEELVAESGASACMQALDGLDWALARLGGDDTRIDHVVVVHTPDREGQDALAAVEHWVNPDGDDQPRVPFEREQHAVVVEPEGDVTDAVDRILAVAPEVVVLAAGPQVTADVATATAEAGWTGLLVGTDRTFEPSLLGDAAVVDALDGRFLHVTAFGPLDQGGKAYTDMRTSLGLGEDRQVDPDDDRVPDNLAWVAGWVSQYPLHEALKEAITRGDLSRAGVVEELRELTVKYDGALPWTTYGGVPNDEVTRRVFVHVPDTDGLMGQALVGDAYVGLTAEHRHVLRPCTEG